MSATARRAGAHGSKLVQQLTEDLAVTDRVYHELKYTQPLVADFVARVRRRLPSGRILIVAPNITLAHALLQLGYQVELWQVPSGTLTEGLETYVTRRASLGDLLEEYQLGALYDMIILPYCLEAAPLHPVTVLARLRPHLRKGGRLILAYRHAGALANRVRALAGRSISPDPIVERPLPTLSWPSLVRHRLFGPDELRSWCLQAGYRVAAQAFVLDHRATVSVEAMSIGPWLKTRAARVLKVALPAVRDCVVAELDPHPVQLAEARNEDYPTVTVIAASSSRARTAQLLEELRHQSYPADRFEVIVIHPAGNEGTALELPCVGLAVRHLVADVPIGPKAANAALARSSAEIIAVTDDLCRIPRGWLEAGVSSLTGWTVAVTGSVLAEPGSPAPFLSLPGLRAVERDEGVFSWANAFYVRAVVAQAGGLDERMGWGWESELSYRLKRLGYAVAFEESVYLTRQFPVPKPRAWLRDEYRQARDIPWGVRRSRGMRATVLAYRLFLSRRTLYFDLLVAGTTIAVVARRPVFATLGIPWVLALLPFVRLWPPSAWESGLRVVRSITARHAVWLAGLTVGSVRARRPVL